MILEDKAQIVFNSQNIRHYWDRGYQGKPGDSCIVNVSDLSHGSHVEITAICDNNCGFERKLQYKFYFKNIKNQGFYTCPSCKNEKMKITSMNKYGVDHPMKLDSVKETQRNVMIEKYGVERPMQNKDVKERMKSTCLRKYGVDNPTKDRDIFEKSLKSSFKITEIYGIKCQGKYEIRFINFINEKYKHLLDKITKKSIRYKHGEKIRSYHVDFYIQEYNLLIEIKSSYWYNYHLETNLLKESACISQGYQYIVIFDNNFDDFVKIIDKLK